MFPMVAGGGDKFIENLLEVFLAGWCIALAQFV